MLYCFTDKIKGLDDLWFLGDTFVATSFRRNFKKIPAERLFCKQTFEVSAFCSSRQCDSNQNVISRLLNSLALGINSSTKLPKYLVIMCDEDIITYLRYTHYGISSMYGTLLEYLAKEINQMLHTRIEQLPKKAKRREEPFIYWLALPFHRCFTFNAPRAKFNASLNAVVKAYGNMRVMKLKDFWNFDDTSLVHPNGCLTETGYSAIWKSVDSAVKFNIQKREEYLAKREEFLAKGCQNRKRNFAENNNIGTQPGRPLTGKRPKRGNRFLLPQI